MRDTLRDLPQVEALLNQPLIGALITRYSQPEVRDALRDALADLRAGLLAQTLDHLPDFTSAAFGDQIAAALEDARAPSLRPVINATGILIHTNLGRAPLAPQAVQALRTVAQTPSNLEFDLGSGTRGSRHSHVEALICTLTGAEAAVVVNNCAAAVLLSLMATANGRSVVASRGELIEIGGAFRLPDVIAQSGATLREVGATNKTRLSDYEAAIDDDTAVLLKSHTSNFKIVGFTSAPARRDLAKLAAARDVILIEDLGSGVLIDLSPYGLHDEPVVADILRAGVDLVMFSGDKLLGGPQAGIIAGRADIVARLKSHPLMRAVRVDKLSLAALEATLRLYLPPHDPLAAVPVLQMLSAPYSMVRARAEQLAGMLNAVGVGGVNVQDTAAYVGGGSLPEQDLQSAAVALRVDQMAAQSLAAALRQGTPPIIGRIEKDHVLLDMRAVTDGDLARIASTLERIVTA